MPLTKAKKNPQKISERREEKDVGRIKEAEKRAEVFFSFFYGAKFLRNMIRKDACFRYLFIFNQLKLIYLCFIHIFRYSYYQEEAGPTSDTSKRKKKLLIIIIIIEMTKIKTNYGEK